MKARQPWLDARAESGLTQRAVERWFIDNVPEIEGLFITQYTLSRFEQGKRVQIRDEGLALLAKCYGKRLSEIDPEKAEAVNSVRDLLVDVRTCERTYAGQAA